ncbi:MAG: helix-hairpin-helix domain-containing protein [Thermodesulfobacteriota bacterium]|nr:helix-hairpin-helix domain-containing protein [Thermodesulfobacteriota bacterium]
MKPPIIMTRYEQQAVLLLAVVLLGVCLYLSYGRTPGSASPTESFPTQGLKYVRVMGGVRSPGLYTFYLQPSVKEVIERAGGLKRNPSHSPVLLSQKVPTGTKLLVTPKPEGTNEIKIIPMTNPERLLLDISMPLNTATEQNLELIPGIGPQLARRIIIFREQNGPYKDIADLMNVEGIGEKKLKEIAPYVIVEN